MLTTKVRDIYSLMVERWLFSSVGSNPTRYHKLETVWMAKVSFAGYAAYLSENLPDSWKRVGVNHGVLNQLISAVARYCYEHLLTGRELVMHLKENTLIDAADFEEEPQGIDWWIDLSLEANMLESHGCIPTFAEDGKSAK